MTRFDSNFDEELSYSDIHDIFKTTSEPLNKELERRTVFSSVDDGTQLKLGKQCLEYVRDLFELLLQAISTAEKIKDCLYKRPQYSLKQAMKVLEQRGSSDLAILKLQEICETHQLLSLGFM